MDDLDRDLARALGSQRLPEERAVAMAQAATEGDRSGSVQVTGRSWLVRNRWWVAAAAVLLATAVPFLAVLGRAPTAVAQTHTAVVRVGHFEVVTSERTLARGESFVVRDWEYVQVDGELVAPGGRVTCGDDGRLEIEHGEAKAIDVFFEGLVAFQERRWDEAAALFARVPTPDGRFYHAAAVGNAGDIETALGLGAAFLAEFPDHNGAALVQYFQGRYLWVLGRRDEAMAAFRALAAAHPGTDLAEAASAYLVNGAAERWREFQEAWVADEFSRGRTLLESLMADHPDSMVVTSGRAAFHHFACVANLGEHLLAIELADAFLAEHADHPSCDYIMYFKAVYLEMAGRTDEAHATCRDLLDRYPESNMLPHVHALLGSGR